VLHGVVRSVARMLFGVHVTMCDSVCQLAGMGVVWVLGG